MKYLLFLLYFTATMVYAQEKNLYIVFNKSSDDTYLWARNIGDTLEIKSFELKKNIPEEKYLYTLYFKKDKLIKVIKGSLSWNNKGKLTFIYISAENKKFKIKKNSEGLNIFKSDDLEKTEFSSLRKVVRDADNIFILISENPKDKFYTAYQVQL